MAINYYLGRSKEDLEKALKRAQDDLDAGSSIESTRAGEVGMTTHFETSTKERIALILQALSKLDPENYPPADTVRTTQTRATFSCGQSVYGEVLQ